MTKEDQAELIKVFSQFWMDLDEEIHAAYETKQRRTLEALRRAEKLSFQHFRPYLERVESKK